LSGALFRVSYITVKAPNSGRTAYRVVPNPDDPIILQLDGELTRVLDISANGFTAVSDLLTPGRRYPYSLDLPTARAPLSGYVDALPGGDEGLLQCRFVELGADDLDALHAYVLIRQKEAIRSIRAGRGG